MTKRRNHNHSTLSDWIAKQERDPAYIAFRAREARLEADGWELLSSAPKDRVTVIRVMCEDDEIREGILHPYYCGSDCPCTDPDDPDARTMYSLFCAGEKEYRAAMILEPQCWTLSGVEPLATHWKPINLVDQNTLP